MNRLSLAVVGVDYENKKGPTRRFEIAMCVPGEPVHFVPEPKNPADENAVAVFSARGIQIGYLTAERAPFMRKMIAAGGVSAIFQKKEQWGATVRAHLDATEPVLPDVNDTRANAWPPPGSQDADWWPDYDQGWD